MTHKNNNLFWYVNVGGLLLNLLYPHFHGVSENGSILTVTNQERNFKKFTNNCVITTRNGHNY